MRGTTLLSNTSCQTRKVEFTSPDTSIENITLGQMNLSSSTKHSIFQGAIWSHKWLADHGIGSSQVGLHRI